MNPCNLQQNFVILQNIHYLQKMGIVIRQSVKASVVNYMGAFIGFLTMMFISTRFLTPEEIGLTRILIEIATLLSAFMLLGVSNSAIRFFPFFRSDSDSTHHGFFALLVRIVCLGVVLVALLFFLFQDSLQRYFADRSDLLNDYILWALPMGIAMAFTAFFEAYASVQMRIAMPKFFREVLLRLLVVGTILLYYFGDLNLGQFVFLYAVIYLLLFFFNFLYLRKIADLSLKMQPSFLTTDLKRKLCNYSLFLVLGGIGGAVVGKIDVFMVGGQLGLDYSGIYSVAMYMAVIIEIPTRAISAISMPLLSDAMARKDTSRLKEIYRQVTLNQFVLSGALFVALWVNIDTIFAFIPHAEIYATGKYVVLFFALSRVVDACLGVGGQMIGYSKYYYVNLFWTFFLGALSIAMNLWLIPIYGITGAAIATFFTVLLSNTIVTLVCRGLLKVSPLTWAWGKVLLILFVLLGVDYLLPSLSSAIVDSLYRSLILLVLGLILLLFGRVSEDINRIFSRIWQYRRDHF